ALVIGNDYVYAFHPEAHVVLGAGDGGGARAGEHDLDLAEVLLDDLERIEERGARDDRRPMLVVMEDGDVERLAQLLFDIEAIGRAHVFEVDPAYRRLEELAKPDHVLRLLRADFQIEDVDVRECLEENAFAFHHRLAGKRADVAEPEDR